MIELEVVAFSVSAESDGIGVGEFLHHLLPVAFSQGVLDEDDAFLFLEPDFLLGQFPLDEKLQRENRLSVLVQQRDVGTMSFDGVVRNGLLYLLEQVLVVFPDAVGAAPFNGKTLLLGDPFLKDVHCLPTKDQVEDGFTVALDFGFLEMGEMGPLQGSAVSGDDSVSAEGASVDGAFFRVVHMDYFPFFITSDGVQQFLSHRFAKVFFQR